MSANTKFIHCDSSETNCNTGMGGSHCKCWCTLCKHEIFNIQKPEWDNTIESPDILKNIRESMVNQLQEGTELSFLKVAFIELIDRVHELEKENEKLHERINDIKYPNDDY